MEIAPKVFLLLMDAHCISASDAACRLFSLPIVENESSVDRIEINLECNHIFYYKECALENEKTMWKEKSTKLLACFFATGQYPNARHIHYVDFPKYFLWDKIGRLWKPRAKYKVQKTTPPRFDFSNALERVAARMYNMRPRESERYFFEHFCCIN